MAAVEATLGWRVARVLGVDDAARVTAEQEAVTTTLVTLTGAAVGGIAALVA